MHALHVAVPYVMVGFYYNKKSNPHEGFFAFGALHRHAEAEQCYVFLRLLGKAHCHIFHRLFNYTNEVAAALPLVCTASLPLGQVHIKANSALFPDCFRQQQIVPQGRAENQL